MNETLSSSLWPNFPTSRQNLNNQFSMGEMNAWQKSTTPIDFFSPDDYKHVWSTKSDSGDETEKESFIKSIWNTNTTTSIHSSTDTSSLGSDGPKHVDETPTNSPSLKRAEIINCNDRWGNVKINQITPWKAVKMVESEQNLFDPMVWRAKIDGTEVWEDYYVKQHGRRRPQTDSSFNGDQVWSSASDISQSPNYVWPPNSNEMSSPVSDISSLNMFNDVNIRSNSSTTNGVRPSMTRNQAQKYLIDMGYSLSDAIGALVNNQMDLPKAISELKSKYRMPSSGQTALPNGMYPPTLSFSNRPGDNVNMTRIPPGTTSINPMLGHNNTNNNSMMAQSYPNTYDMFYSDPNDQILDSPYMNMDPTMSQYTRIADIKRQSSQPIVRDTSFRNNFPHNVQNSYTNRTLSTNCGQYNTGDMSALSQGINRMNIIGQNTVYNGSNKWPGNSGANSSNGYTTNANINNTNNANSNSMMLNNNNNSMDMRQNFAPALQQSAFARSISKQQIYQRNPSAIAWHSDVSSISPNGALNDINQLRIAKNLPCTAMSENVVGIIIRKVPSNQIEIIKSICLDTGSVTSFQLQPHIQSILVHFNSPLDARRCMNIIQNQLNIRVDPYNDDYIH